MGHAIISKGVPRPLPGSVTFFLQKKKVTKEKLSFNRRAAFFASIFAPPSADCESSAYLVSAFG